MADLASRSGVPADANRGDDLDHVALDVEGRRVLAVVRGTRDAETAVGEVKDLVRGRMAGLEFAAGFDRSRKVTQVLFGGDRQPANDDERGTGRGEGHD